ncbi:MAG: bifunctional diguanylate cyclase/phosphodiesterase [Mariprofundus sp.]|nr:bifunctional diguanylate cyclase/phosphodiesterase [Mariprofundus sp.]
MPTVDLQGNHNTTKVIPDAQFIHERHESIATLTQARELQYMQEKFSILQQQCHKLTKQNTLLTKKIKRKAKKIKHDALHDGVTGLGNRNMLSIRTTHSLQIASRQQLPCSLMMIGLNAFKNINDTLGHHIGDMMLHEVGRRIKQCLRKSDTLAKMGGDEFAVFLFENTSTQTQVVTDKILCQLSKPFSLKHHILSIDAAVGIAEFPKHSENIGTLLMRADVAMMHAKKSNLEKSLYDVQQDKTNLEQLSLYNQLKHAINNDALELYYQPQVLCNDNGPPSLEALIRWPHSEKGMIYPDQFIPMAEKSGLIIPMTWWVLETAVKQCAAWFRAGLKIKVSVNFSALCLQESDIIERVKACLNKYQLPDYLLVVEITESMIMVDSHQASKVLIELDKLHVDVSIDDFGTGHSSLAYLKHLQVDELKIDRSFILGMHEHKNDEIIVRTVINMAHNMGLRVIAEGVETRNDWDKLTAMGCDRIQGYFINRPQPVDRTTNWLESFAIDGLQLDEIGPVSDSLLSVAFSPDKLQLLDVKRHEKSELSLC